MFKSNAIFPKGTVDGRTWFFIPEPIAFNASSPGANSSGSLSSTTATASSSFSGGKSSGFTLSDNFNNLRYRACSAVSGVFF